VASPGLHREAGIFTAKTGKIDWVIGVEGDAKEIVEGAVAAGVPREQTRFFASSEQAAAFLEDLLTAGDVLLVKGSRGVQMERIVESLLARHAAPVEIARQEVRH
jgi:UDP-N-acetylmuramoyl-tripeptide--D-alanyl-D-alanine ligase